MARPSIAVFGAGLIGARHVEEATRQASLCAIVDPTETAKALARRLGAPIFASPDACLEAMQPDGIVVATPNHLHEAHAALAIEAGIPVLIEKPLAHDLASADRIATLAARKGTPVLVGHHRRHNPIIQCAKSMIEAGELGEIIAVNGQFWLYKPDDYFDASWRTKPGAGPLMINLIHDVDLLRHLCGDVAEVQAMRSNRARGFEVEDTAAILLRFAGGALGSFTVTDTAAAPWSWEMSSGENPIYPHLGGACYQIGGTRGSLSVPDLRLWSYAGARSWWEPLSATDRSVAGADAFARQFTHFLDVIDGAPPLVTARDGRESLAIVEHAARAPLEVQT